MLFAQLSLKQTLSQDFVTNAHNKSYIIQFFLEVASGQKFGHMISVVIDPGENSIFRDGKLTTRIIESKGQSLVVTFQTLFVNCVSLETCAKKIQKLQNYKNYKKLCTWRCNYQIVYK